MDVKLYAYMEVYINITHAQVVGRFDGFVVCMYKGFELMIFYLAKL